MSFRTTIITGKTNHIDTDLMAMMKDLLDGNSGIVGDNDFLVTQNSPLGLSVLVGPGVMYSYISSVGGYYRHELTDTSTALTIDPNSSGSTRIDLICIKTDLTVAPDANGGGPASLVVVKGTAGAGVPATPANHVKRAEITVDNGAANITNAKINNLSILTQLKNRASYTVLTGTSPTLDLSSNRKSFSLVLSGNTTLAVSNVRVGDVFMIDVQQAASGGPHTLTHFAGVTWMTIDGSAPTMPTTASKRITYGFKCIAANTYLGYLVGRNSA
jgi:hypothetical protein